jgi:hypothetical protein
MGRSRTIRAATLPSEALHAAQSLAFGVIRQLIGSSDPLAFSAFCIHS